MKYVVSVLTFLFLMLCTQCASPGITKAMARLDVGYGPMSAPSVTVHCDKDFTPEERSAISDAAEVWRLQTGGLADIRVLWDLDFNDISALQAHVDANHTIMVRVTSDMLLVKRMDFRAQGTVLGWVGPAGGIHNPWKERVTVAFVVDRIPKRAFAIQVMVHEFGHLLGLPHLPPVQSIMYPAAIKERSSCLTGSDLQAFCGIHNCAGYKMYPC